MRTSNAELTDLRRTGPSIDRTSLSMPPLRLIHLARGPCPYTLSTHLTQYMITCCCERFPGNPASLLVLFRFWLVCSGLLG